MTKKRIKKILLDDLDDKYKFDVDFEQIYNNYLEKNGKVVNKNNVVVDFNSDKNPFKLATRYLSIALTCCFVALCIIIGTVYINHSNGNKINFDEINDYIIENSIIVDTNQYDLVSVSNKVNLYIFKGFTANDNDVKQVFIYYVIMDNNEVTLETSDFTTPLSNKCCGILEEFDDDDSVHELKFSLIVNGEKANYSLQK